jgi:hypothetical protein
MMTMDNTNNAIAGAALSSPWWLPGLERFSEIAALLLPIAGLVWLVVQIVGYLYKHGFYKNGRKS